MSTNEITSATVLGQKYAFATASLILGICCFVNLVGLEKAILAVTFGWMALRSNPAPALVEHRGWAKAGVAFGAAALVLVPVLVVLNYNRIVELIELLSKVSGGR